MQLAPFVFLAPVRERAVALDLAADRYLALGPRLAAAAFALMGDIEPFDSKNAELTDARNSLVSQGLLIDAFEPQPLTSRPTRSPAQSLWPRCGYLGEPLPRPNAGTAGQILLTLARVSRSLAARPFHLTIRRLACVPVAAPPARRPEQDLLDDFAAVRPWFPVKPICRLDAMALCLHLRRNGHPAQLVFGVRLEPFRAHCWVQIDARTINEAHDVAARFSPILVV